MRESERQPLVLREEPVRVCHAILRLLCTVSPLAIARRITMGGNCFGIVLLTDHDVTLLPATSLISSAHMAVINSSSAALFSIGIMVGEVYGANQKLETGRTHQQCIVYSLVLTAPITVLLSYAGNLLVLTGQKPALTSVAQDSFNEYRWGVLPILCFAADQQLMLVTSQPWSVVPVVFANACLTLLFAYPLIYSGCFSLAAAARYANLLSYWLISGAIKLYIRLNSRYREYEYFNFRFRGAGCTLWKLVSRGLKIGLQAGSELIAIQVMTLMTGRFGDDALSAEQITLQTLFILPVCGFGQSSGIVMSQEVGSGNVKNISRYGYCSFAIGTDISLVGLCWCFSPGLLIDMFPHNSNVEDLSGFLFRVCGTGMVLDVIRNINAGNLRGSSDYDFAMGARTLLIRWLKKSYRYVREHSPDIEANGFFHEDKVKRCQLLMI